MRMWPVDALSHLWLAVIWAFSCDDWLVFTCSWAVHVRSAWALCSTLRGSPVTLFHTLRAPSRALRRGHDLSPVSHKLPTERSRFRRERETEKEKCAFIFCFLSATQTCFLSLSLSDSYSSLLTWYKTLHCQSIMNIGLYENTFRHVNSYIYI